MYYYRIYEIVLKSDIELSQLVTDNSNEAEFMDGANCSGDGVDDRADAGKSAGMDAGVDAGMDDRADAGVDNGADAASKNSCSDDICADVNRPASLTLLPVNDVKPFSVCNISKEEILFNNQYATFHILNGEKIEVAPYTGTTIADITPFILGYSIAMLFWQRGMTAIHCSALEIEGNAVIVSGDSGAGKSTLSRELIKRGAKLMTDDVAIIEFGSDNRIFVRPAFPEQKLCRDAMKRNDLDLENSVYINEDKDKFAVREDIPFCDEKRELKSMFVLSKSAKIKSPDIISLAGVDKLTAVMKNQFLYPMFEHSYGLPQDDMRKVIRIANSIPVYKVVRPTEGDTAANIAEEVKKLAVNG